MFLNDAKAQRSWELAYFCIESALRLGASVRIFDLGAATEMPLERALAHDWPTSDAPQIDLAAALGRIQLRAGSLRVLVSDLLCEIPPEIPIAALTGARGRAVIFAPFCKDEAHPDWSGNIHFEECESGARERRRVPAEVLARYRSAYEMHFGLWREQCVRRAVAFARVAAEGEFLACLRSEGVSSGAVLVSA
jgi:hypothetical protein